MLCYLDERFLTSTTSSSCRMTSALPLANKFMGSGLSFEHPALEALVFPAEMELRGSQAAAGHGE